MTDKPPTPEVLDAELVPPARIRRGNPVGNPSWKKGGPTPNPDGAGAGGATTTRQLRRKVRDWLDEHGFEKLTEIALDPNTAPDTAVATILKLASFVLPVAKEGDQDIDDPTGQGGTQTRTMTVTFVTPKKDGGD